MFSDHVIISRCSTVVVLNLKIVHETAAPP